MHTFPYDDVMYTIFEQVNIDSSQSFLFLMPVRKDYVYCKKKQDYKHIHTY